MTAKRLKAGERMQVEEAAALFEKSLGALFGTVSASGEQHVLGRLSVSLRKVLLLMAMQRFSPDPAILCRALGISRRKLERELRLCGLTPKLTRAA